MEISIPYVAWVNAVNMSLLIAILVALDIVTKWCCIIDTYNTDHKLECTFYNTFRGIFFRAWQEGYLQSRKFREELGKKAKAYGIAILMAIAVYLFPDYKINGIQADETLSFLIYLTVVVAECFSIAENLKDMGVKEASFVKDGLLAVLRKFGVSPSLQPRERREHREDD